MAPPNCVVVPEKEGPKESQSLVDQACKETDDAEDVRDVQVEPAGGPSLATATPITSKVSSPGPCGVPSMDANPPKAFGDSNPAPPRVPKDNGEGPTSGSPDPRNCRYLPDLSEVPDSQPVPACLPGQSGDSPAPPLDVELAGFDDRSTGPHASTTDKEAHPGTSAVSPAKDPSPSPSVAILQRPQAQPAPTRPNAESLTPASDR